MNMLYCRGLKLAALRMIIFGSHLRIKMKIFERSGMFLSGLFCENLMRPSVTHALPPVAPK